jgi:hypothetical protein
MIPSMIPREDLTIRIRREQQGARTGQVDLLARIKQDDHCSSSRTIAITIWALTIRPYIAVITHNYNENEFLCKELALTGICNGDGGYLTLHALLRPANLVFNGNILSVSVSSNVPCCELE